jgi:hypothetical protein
MTESLGKGADLSKIIHRDNHVTAMQELSFSTDTGRPRCQHRGEALSGTKLEGHGSNLWRLC